MVFPLEVPVPGEPRVTCMNGCVHLLGPIHRGWVSLGRCLPEDLGLAQAVQIWASFGVTQWVELRWKEGRRKGRLPPSHARPP